MVFVDMNGLESGYVVNSNAVIGTGHSAWWVQNWIEVLDKETGEITYENNI